jgi:hypothetical protein
MVLGDLNLDSLRTLVVAQDLGGSRRASDVHLRQKRTPETEKPAREFVSLEGTKFHWLVGAKDPETINPDNWVLDQALLDRLGVQDYQVDLLEDYKSNIALNPGWQAAFRAHKPRTLIAWGKKDPSSCSPELKPVPFQGGS